MELTVSHLSHTYAGRRPNGRAHTAVAALRDVSFRVGGGSMTAVIGPNGSGKSTLFRILAGLLPVQEGEIAFGRPADAVRPGRRADVGFVFQSPALDKDLTVFENLYHHALLHGFRLRRASLPNWFDGTLGLASVVDRKVHELSGGYQRRVELAKVLLADPALIVLDEPFAGLDIQSRDAFFGLIHELSRVDGTTVLVMTHVLSVAAQCDAVAVLEQGALIAHDAPANLLSEFGPSVVEIRSRRLPAILDRITGRHAARIVPLEDDRALVLSVTLPQVLETIDMEADAVDGIEARTPGLEDYFIARTGRVFEDSGLRSLAA